MILKKRTVFLCLVLALLLVFPFLPPPGIVSAVEATDYKSSVLMDYGTGEILSQTNEKEHLPIASVTKLMTLLLTFEALDRNEIALDEILTASDNAAGMGGSQVFIDAGSEYTVENLLHAVIISSANDASVMLAERLGGSEDNFVVSMNARAQELGANNTNYTNCTGLPSANAYSCAHDVALIMREVLNHPLYFEISKIWMEDFQHPSGRITEMANTNKLLRSYTGCDAGKTGSTNEAGYCMSASAKKGDMRLIAVVLGADSSKVRFARCADLFNYGFANFTSERLVNSDKEILDAPTVSKAKNAVQFKPQEDYFVLKKKGENKDIQINYEFDRLIAPIAQNEVVGKIIVTENNKVLKEINIISVNDIEAKSYGDTIHDILNDWSL